MAEPHPSPTPTSLPQELSRLSRAVGDLRTLLDLQRPAFEKAGVRIPPIVFSDLGQVGRSLSGLSQQADVEGQELRRLRALAGIGQVVNSSLDLTVVLNEVMDTIIRLTGAERGFLMLRDETGRMHFRIARNVERESLNQSEFEISRTIVERVAQDGVGIVTTNAQEDPRFGDQQSVMAYHLRSILCVPLKVKDAITGVIYADNRIRTGLFTEKDLDLLAAFANEAAVALENARLFGELQHSNEQLVLAYDSTLEGWSKALDLRDRETEGHTQRVTEYTLRLARASGRIGEAEMEHVRRGALLHDIGKMGIPDAILHKPGPLSDDEWVIMRRHPGYAFDMLSKIDYLRPAMDIPYCHHEKWDGSGYPRGLRGEAIPFAARLFALADVWDALTSDRPYRKAWPKEKTREHIRNSGGTHFDPVGVAILLDLDL